jgi:CheY-like chemotaxis protein
MLHDRLHPLFLLEDDPDDVTFVRRALSRANISNPLEIRSTVSDARAYFEQLDGKPKPALCIVDVYLPNGETGLDFLAWLRRRPSPLNSVPALMYTVSNDKVHAANAANLGSVLFVRKPVTEETLTDAVLRLGFVITNTAFGSGPTRVIEPR